MCRVFLDVAGSNNRYIMSGLHHVVGYILIYGINRYILIYGISCYLHAMGFIKQLHSAVCLLLQACHLRLVTRAG
jgi:hypothetical protein